MRLSYLQPIYGLGIQKLVQLHQTVMAAATSFDNTLVAGLAVGKYFLVKLQLVGRKKYITNT